MIVRHKTYRFGIPAEDDTHCSAVIRESADSLVMYGVPLDPADINPPGDDPVYLYPPDVIPLAIRYVTIVEGDTFLMFPCGSECEHHTGESVHYNDAGK